MKWQECFEKYKYTPFFKNNSTAYEEIIEIFKDDDCISDELLQIYLSDREDELFLILRIENESKIEKVCEKWDRKILAFLNFGVNLGFSDEIMHKIEYNVVQIILCANDCDKKIEKSTSISRKIILKCEKDDELIESEQLLLPFWYQELKEITHNDNERKLLDNLLPKKENMLFLYQKREKLDRRISDVTDEKTNFNDKEFEIVKGWVENCL